MDKSGRIRGRYDVLPGGNPTEFLKRRHNTDEVSGTMVGQK